MSSHSEDSPLYRQLVLNPDLICCDSNFDYESPNYFIINNPKNNTRYGIKNTSN